jgi:putative FmdB family regulatory protein
MPFYEYECTACKFYVEALQKISDPPLKKCPSCKKQTMKRLVSAPVFRLKGGGWYETDFKSEGEQKRNIHGREEAAETKAEESKPAVTESKPEAKESKPEAKESTTKANGKSAKTAAPSRASSKARTKPGKAPAKRAAAKKSRRR